MEGHRGPTDQDKHSLSVRNSTFFLLMSDMFIIIGDKLSSDP